MDIRANPDAQIYKILQYVAKKISSHKTIYEFIKKYLRIVKEELADIIQIIEVFN